MKLANVQGRAVLVLDDSSERRDTQDVQRGVDVAAASGGAFGSSPPDVYARWSEFCAWATGDVFERNWSEIPEEARVVFDRADLHCPSPAPRQIFAIGRNYNEGPQAGGGALPEGLPPTFTKFVSALAGAETTVALPAGGRTDWEVELVVVIGQEVRDVDPEDAWTVVAGVSVGQDLSERDSQMSGAVPQFSLGKSFPGFAPVGPWLVTTDDLDDPDDLQIGCAIDGEVVQAGRTTSMILPVRHLIARLSRIVTLYPGDLIFTGTPAGVGQHRNPRRFLLPGQQLRSWISQIGEIHQHFTSSSVENHESASEQDADQLLGTGARR